MFTRRFVPLVIQRQQRAVADRVVRGPRKQGHVAVMRGLRSSWSLCLGFAAIVSACAASHVREPSGDLVDGGRDHDGGARIGDGSLADGETSLLCSDVLMELTVPDRGCVSFAIPASAPRTAPPAVACSGMGDGYRVRLRSSGRVGLSVSVALDPPCEGCTGVAELVPGADCEIFSCSTGFIERIRLQGPPAPITELMFYPLDGAGGSFVGSICPEP